MAWDPQKYRGRGPLTVEVTDQRPNYIVQVEGELPGTSEEILAALDSGLGIGELAEHVYTLPDLGASVVEVSRVDTGGDAGAGAL